MAAKWAIISLIGLLSMLILLSKPALCNPDNKINCGKVVSDVTPCLSYVTDKADSPSANCCNGVKEVNSLVKTKADRQAACECLKKAMGNIKYDAYRVLALPKKCGISFTFPPYSPTVDCSKA